MRNGKKIPTTNKGGQGSLSLAKPPNLKEVPPNGSRDNGKRKGRSEISEASESFICNHTLSATRRGEKAQAKLRHCCSTTYQSRGAFRAFRAAHHLKGAVKTMQTPYKPPGVSAWLSHHELKGKGGLGIDIQNSPTGAALKGLTHPQNTF